jgi:TRAP-type transport system small permease protein
MAVVRMIDSVNRALGVIIGLMVAVMSLVIIYHVFSRFLVGPSPAWSEALARYLMIYLVFMGAAIALRHQRLIAIQALSQSLSERPRRVLGVAVLVVCLVFFVLLLYQGVLITQQVSGQSSASLGVSMAVPYAAIPVGAALMILNTVAVILETLAGGGEGEAD